MNAIDRQQVAQAPCVPTAPANVGDSLPITRNPNAAHLERVRAYNAQCKRLAGVKFRVIEVATGRVVGDDDPLPYDFAKHVRDTRDLFNAGRFLVKRIAEF